MPLTLSSLSHSLWFDLFAAEITANIFDFPKLCSAGDSFLSKGSSSSLLSQWWLGVVGCDAK